METTIGKPPHLGGHQGVTHKDFGALDVLVKAYSPKTGIDLGCGVGGMIRPMKKRGIDCYGIDGDPTLANRIVLHDFYQGPLEIEPVDLCWTVEFLEHIGEEFLPNVWSVLEKCRVVFCTHGLPKTSHRRRHVNCQPEQYWIDAFRRHGFGFAQDVTDELRRCSTMDREFVRDSGKVFVRNT